MGFGKILGIIAAALVVAGGLTYIIIHPGKDIAQRSLPNPEQERQSRVATELALTYPKMVETDLKAKLKELPGIGDGEVEIYISGIKKLLEIAPIMQKLYLKQIAYDGDPMKAAVTDNDRELVRRYGEPWCQGDSTPYCSADPSFPKRLSGVISRGISCDIANKDASPFEAVIFDPAGAVAVVPYAELWPQDLSASSAKLKEVAAIFDKIPRETATSQYLRDLAEAFISNEPYPFAVADDSWVKMLMSDTYLFARIGPDEVGGDSLGDSCESKARFHFNLGLVDLRSNEIISRIKGMSERFEESFASLLNDPKKYAPTAIQVQLPIFLNVIYQNGDDAGGPGGTNIGQTLPNWCGSDGKGECMRGTMIYVNKVVQAYNQELMSKYLLPLFSPETRKYFNAASAIDSVVYHEMFHNYGPKDKKKIPDREDTYGDHLITSSGTSWKLPVEELKAQTGSLFMANEFYKDAVKKHEAKEISDETFKAEEKRYREHIVYDMAWSLRMILRGSKTGVFDTKNPYSRLSTIQIGFLTEEGALKYDVKKKEWTVDFEKMPAAIDALMKISGELYTSLKPDEIEKTFLYYMIGDGSKTLHIDRLIQVAGRMPSVMFGYVVK